MGNLGTIKTPESFTSMGGIPVMTAYCETSDCFETSLNQHSDTLEGLRHRAYRDRSRDDRVGIMICSRRYIPTMRLSRRRRNISLRWCC